MKRSLALGTSAFALATPAAMAAPSGPLVGSYGTGTYLWTAPTNGVFEIVAGGAPGGSGNGGTAAGGLGAGAIETMVFVAGQQIKVQVGAPGQSNGTAGIPATYGGGGGGGGTFVTAYANFTNNGRPLLIAGGGGGTGATAAAQGAGGVGYGYAAAKTLGTTSSLNAANGSGAGSPNFGGNRAYLGFGGYSAMDKGYSGYGAGGGGFGSSGDADKYGAGGASWSGGLAGGGGLGSCPSGVIGYGGFGGGGSGGCYGGGGGGGYTGGDGGLVGGGGGSYLTTGYTPRNPDYQYWYSGTGISATPSLKIYSVATYSSDTPAPEPATLGLLGAGLAGLGLARRRRRLGA